MDRDAKPSKYIVIGCHHQAVPTGRTNPSSACAEASILFLTALAFIFLCIILCIDTALELSVTSATISSCNLSSTSGGINSCEFGLEISVHNPNKNSDFSLSGMTPVLLFRPDHHTTSVTLPPFVLTPGNSVIAHAKYLEVGVAEEIPQQRVINFSVEVNLWIVSKYMGHVMVADCEDVKIVFKNRTATEGSMEGTPKPCKVVESGLIG